MSRVRSLLLALVLLAPATRPAAEERFPPPEFETGYAMPGTTVPGREALPAAADLAILAGTLALATWLVLKRRSRAGVVALGVASLAWFGFGRTGCICAIGSVQNVALALADPGYAVPLVVLGFFLLPLVVALFFGRTFCAAVCPQGAMQDLVLVRPLAVPVWLDHGLRLLAYAYLGLGVLLAATGSAFVICEYDPFVAFFRMSGGAGMLALGAGFLVLGMFVGRPYCRWLCPYGALLGLASVLSRWRVTITPDVCTQCRLCEGSCPFGSIRKPPAPDAPPPDRAAGRRRLLAILLLAPVLLAGGAGLGHRLGAPLSKLHPVMRLADHVRLDKAGLLPAPGDDVTAFRASGKPVETLYAEAGAVARRTARGGAWLGAFLGLVVAVKLFALSLGRRQTDYEAERISCVACARCFASCPQEHLRLGGLPGAAPAPPAGAPPGPPQAV
jgi:ferredoxin